VQIEHRTCIGTPELVLEEDLRSCGVHQSTMFGGDDDFDGTIDVNKILNDPSLHDELLSLGWVDHGAPAVSGRKPPPKAKKPVSSNRADDKPQHVAAMIDSESIVPLDIGGIGLVDEDNVQFTDADMEDEGLLAEFDYISGGGGVHSAEQHEEEEEEQEEHDAADTDQEPGVAKSTDTLPRQPQASAPAPAASAQIPGIPTVEDAKRNAVKFKREGNQAEALKWLRYSKQLENGTFTSPPVLPANVSISGNTASVSVTTRMTHSTPAAAQQASSTATRSSVATSASVGPNATSSAKGTPPVPPLTTQPSITHQAITTTMSSSVGLGGDPFEPLESAIVEASNSALREAKAAEKADKKLAVAKMREYKTLQQELVVLRSRRNTPGASPALFHWQVRLNL
jgi:hypothetical protein